MLKKASTQNTFKEQYSKLQERLSKNLEDANKLISSTSIPSYSAVPDPRVLSNLLAECEDSEFWLNFRRAAPIIFCTAIEHDQNLKTARDMSFIEELLKTKSILAVMNDKIEKGDSDVDIVEYSLATKMLENKLQVLHALNVNVDNEDQTKITLNVKGSTKAVQIDLAKLREAVTVIDNQVEEKEENLEERKKNSDLENINMEGITEEEFINKAIERIGQVKKDPKNNKVLERDCFIKIFKFTGDFAKMKTTEMKKKAQQDRMACFGTDHKKYLEVLKKTIADEETAYESSSQVMFDRLSISPEMFERTQQYLMNDPYASMELFNLGINMEAPSNEPPAELTKDKTVDLVKKSNDFAFDLFKKEYISSMNQDPMLMPVVISAIAHDWVFKEHGYKEEDFKAALFKFKVYEDPSVGMHMQQKQMELLSMAGAFNPYMMGGMGGGMPPMGGPGMGGPPMGGPPMGGFGGMGSPGGIF